MTENWLRPNKGAHARISKIWCSKGEGDVELSKVGSLDQGVEAMELMLATEIPNRIPCDIRQQQRLCLSMHYPAGEDQVEICFEVMTMPRAVLLRYAATRLQEHVQQLCVDLISQLSGEIQEAERGWKFDLAEGGHCARKRELSQRRDGIVE